MTADDEYLPTRHSLLSRLKNLDDNESWKLFFDTYWRLIYSAAVKTGLTDAEAQDVVQETLISVMKTMPEGKYDASKGSFKKWLLGLTKWRITDQFRKRQPDSAQESSSGYALKHRAAEANDYRIEPETATVDRIPNTGELELEAAWDSEWEKNLIGVAIERVKKRVDPKQYQLFDLYVIKEWPVAKIIQTLKVNRGQIYLAKHRIHPVLKKEIEYLRTKIV